MGYQHIYRDATCPKCSAPAEVTEYGNINGDFVSALCLACKHEETADMLDDHTIFTDWKVDPNDDPCTWLMVQGQ